MNGFCRGKINFIITNEYTTKSTFRISCQSMIPGAAGRIPGSNAAYISVFDNGKYSLFFKFTDQLDGRINIYQVVVGNLFPVKLFENGFPITFKISLLVRVLTITQMFDGFGNAGWFSRIEICIYGEIVTCNNFKSFSSEIFSLS